jgi:hypothetical protein
MESSGLEFWFQQGYGELRASPNAGERDMKGTLRGNTALVKSLTVELPLQHPAHPLIAVNLKEFKIEP